MIQIYGRRKCQGTRKAERYFSERGIAFQKVDLDQKVPGRREIELFVQVVGEEELIDDSSRAYQDRGLAYMEFDPIDELLENPELIRTPIVRREREVVVGSDEAAWKRLAEKDRL